jgi:V/A-type H+-transporting ATPase subunit E
MESGKAEKLKQKIINDAETEARATVEDGQARARKIKAEAEDQARVVASDFDKKAKAHAEEYIRRQISLRELEARKAVLSEKGALLDQVFDQALAKLRERDRKGGYSLTRKLLLGAIEVGDEEIILSGEDRREIGDSFVEDLNRELRKVGKRGEVKLSAETRDIKGGFILKRGRVEVNGSFDTLLEMLRDDIETEVAGILFAGGKEQ